jgi:hypothetical protein
MKSSFKNSGFRGWVFLFAGLFLFSSLLFLESAAAQKGRGRGRGQGGGAFNSTALSNSAAGTDAGFGVKLRKRDGSGQNCSTDPTVNGTAFSGASNWNTLRGSNAAAGMGKKYGTAGSAAGTPRSQNMDTSIMSTQAQSAYQAFQDSRNKMIELRRSNAGQEDIDSAYKEFLSSRDAFKNIYSTERFSTITPDTSTGVQEVLDSAVSE